MARGGIPVENQWFPKGFGWCTTKTDSCRRGNVHLCVWSKDWCYRNKGFFPTWQPRISIWKTKPPSFPFISLQSHCISAVLVAPKESSTWRSIISVSPMNLHVYSKKTCESCFKSIIYKCLFYLSVSDVLQNLSKPNVSLCWATFLSIFETWPSLPPTCTHFHYRHSAGGVMRGSCNPPDIQSCDF